MAILIDEHFSGGSDGATLTTSNTAFSSIVGAPTFTTDSLSGLAMRVVTATDNRYGNVAFSNTTTLWVRFYIKVLGSTAQAYLTNVPSSLANIRVNANNSLRVRNGAGAVGVDSTVLLSSSSFTRVEYRMDWAAGEQQFRMFSGANLEGSTPDYDSGVLVLTTGTGVSSIGVGSLLGAVVGASYVIEDLKISNSEWVGANNPAPPSSGGFLMLL